MPKKVLVLCRDYPPMNTISAQRPKAWYKYLSDHDFIVSVVTPVPDSSIDPNIHRVNVAPLLKTNIGFRKIFRKTRSFFELWLPYLIPQSSRLWPIYKKANQLLATKGYDYIIATGEPFILFIFANLLSKKHKVKWIADYRDPWTSSQNNHSANTQNSFLNKILYRQIEKKHVRSASMITTPARSYIEKINESTGHPNIQLVLNGHDIDFNIQTQPNQETFKIGYSGRLYDHQPIEEFLASFGQFLQNNDMPKNIKLVFYGLNDWKAQKQRVITAGIQWLDHIEFRSNLDYVNYINQLAECHIFLLLTKKNMRWLNAKVFDYLALPGKTMLFPNNDGELNLILNEASSGTVIDSQKEMTDFLQTNYNDFLEGDFQQQSSSVKQFSRQESTAIFANLLNEINTCAEL